MASSSVASSIFLAPDLSNLTAYLARFSLNARWQRLICLTEQMGKNVSAPAKQIILKEANNLGMASNAQAFLRVTGQLGQKPDGHDVARLRGKLDDAKTILTAAVEMATKGLVKEDSRVAINNLGNLLLDHGRLADALPVFTRSKNYCTTAAHQFEMCSNILKCALPTHNFSAADAAVAEGKTTQTMGPKPKEAVYMFLVATGLSQLAQGNFKNAATSFLEATESYIPPIIPTTSSTTTTNNNSHPLNSPSIPLNPSYDLLGGQDLVLYATLTALCSDRSLLMEYASHSDSAFSKLLSTVPEVRLLLGAFQEQQYEKVMALFEAMKFTLSVDPYLQTKNEQLHHLLKAILHALHKFAPGAWHGHFALKGFKHPIVLVLFFVGDGKVSGGGGFGEADHFLANQEFTVNGKYQEKPPYQCDFDLSYKGRTGAEKLSFRGFYVQHCRLGDQDTGGLYGQWSGMPGRGQFKLAPMVTEGDEVVKRMQEQQKQARIRELMDMGFTKDMCELAVDATDNLDASVKWIMKKQREHEAKGAEHAAVEDVPLELIQQITMMGFTAEQAHFALVQTKTRRGWYLDAALDMLVSG